MQSKISILAWNWMWNNTVCLGPAHGINPIVRVSEANRHTETVKVIFLYMPHCPVHNFMLHFSCCIALLLVRWDYWHRYEHSPGSLWPSPVMFTKIVVWVNFYAMILPIWILSPWLSVVCAFHNCPWLAFDFYLTSSFLRNSLACFGSQNRSSRQVGYIHHTLKAEIFVALMHLLCISWSKRSGMFLGTFNYNNIDVA